ncbi:MAG: A/G-specific adenine glycosylase [Chloroflexi bacterium]|nr:MAG: A/G-specific adenine glycosylase [Chloroflexota bacterium]
MWTTGLARWYAGHGRHDLPWRHTRDPWPVLVSEVMLQQTQVVRVRGRWESFLDRWPTPAACAADPLAEVLRFWQGLCYPRRARGLWLTAASVEAVGWPRTEQGLRALPGIGQYTARALLTLAMGQSSSPPLDVNLSRVAARAALGRHPRDSQRADIERAVVEGRPRTLDARDYTLALFDVGALHCRAIPRCSGCPLARRCRWLARGSPLATRPQRVQRYERSMRQLRGSVLAAQLSRDPAATLPDLVHRVAALPMAHEPDAVARALASLRADGLLEDSPASALRTPR